MMSQTKTGAERRRHSRFKSLSILQVLNEAGRSVEENPTLVNMSESGLAFYSNEQILLNDRIRLNLTITEFNSTVAAYAKVVWTQASTEHVGTHFIGVEFVGLEETDRDVLRRLERACQEKK